MSRNTDLELGIIGKNLWQRDVWDRYMRDEFHLNSTIEYIHNNPVKAGLCEIPEDWRWSSAWKGWETPGAPGAPGTSPAMLIN